MHLSLPKRFPLFILPSSVCCSLETSHPRLLPQSPKVCSVSSFVCWSPQCLISALTQGRGAAVITFFKLTGSVVLWRGRNTANKYHWPVWGVLAVFQVHWVCTHSWHGLHFSDSRLLCQELSEVGPGLHELSRSKPLRFRFSSTPQRRRLGWACFVPFPGPISSGDHVLGEHSHPQLGSASYRLPHPRHLVFWVYNGTPSQVCCVSLLGR